MPRWVYEQASEKPRRWEAIRCLDCKTFLGSKSEIRPKHIGHEVIYAHKDGTPDE